MTQEEFDKAPLLDQILYDTTGMLVDDDPSIAEAMENYHQAKLKLLGIADVSVMLPTDEEIINEAEVRYPVKTHNNPDNSPYVGTQKTFIHGVRWALAFVQGNYR